MISRLVSSALFALILHAPHEVPTMHATGAMDVTIKPDPAAPSGLSRLLLTKHYHGTLEADATGEMVSGGDPKSGMAGYVAFETITGKLAEHTGTFQVMQYATLQAGQPDLRATVVPGSGTGELQGLTGTMQLNRAADGCHTYVLDYTLPAAASKQE